MTKRDQLVDLLAAMSVICASLMYASPFLLIGVWLTGLG